MISALRIRDADTHEPESAADLRRGPRTPLLLHRRGGARLHPVGRLPAHRRAGERPGHPADRAPAGGPHPGRREADGTRPRPAAAPGRGPRRRRAGVRRPPRPADPRPHARRARPRRRAGPGPTAHRHAPVGPGGTGARPGGGDRAGAHRRCRRRPAGRRRRPQRPAPAALPGLHHHAGRGRGDPGGALPPQPPPGRPRLGAPDRPHPGPVDRRPRHRDPARPTARRLPRRRLPPRIRHRGTDLHGLAALAAAGHGLTALPLPLAATLPAVAAVPVAAPRLVHRTELIHPTLPTDTARRLADLLTDRQPGEGDAGRG